MRKELLHDHYSKLNISETEINQYVDTIIQFEQCVKKDIDDTSIEDIKVYFNFLIEHQSNTYNKVIHIARYFYYAGKKEEYIHMTKYFNSLGVLENIINRVSLYGSKEQQEQCIQEIRLPDFGTDSSALPEYTNHFMTVLQKHFKKDQCNKILAGNNHNIPESSFLAEKEVYNNSSSFVDYLKNRHERKVQELQDHLDQNKVWFEQIITKEAVEYVKSNQEILSGVIENEKLYITKIPYDINLFLTEKDDLLKKYYACHCSFVRENIKNQNFNIDKDWCYCSAGFAKHPFETILGTPLEIKLLKTPLDGDNICRFEIDLSTVKYK